MILDADRGDTGWYVWDCERCLKMRWIVWLNDETAEFVVVVVNFAGSLVRGNDGGVLRERKQARRIDIYPEKKLVLFNQIEDEDPVRLEYGTSATKCADRINMKSF